MGGVGGSGGGPCVFEACAEQCPEGRPYCDALLGCVECGPEEPCKGDLVCDRGVCAVCGIVDGVDSCTMDDPNSYCFFGECVEEGCAGCGSCKDGRCDCPDACGNQQVCDLSRAVCVECRKDDDCGESTESNRRCSPDLQCVDCLVSNDCFEQPAVCDDDHECEPACCTNADCTEGEACLPTGSDTGVKRCQPCTEHLQCAPQICDAVTQRCAACTDNSQCDPQVCDEETGECVTAPMSGSGGM